MFYYLTVIYICVYMVQRNLIVNCQSTTADPSVSLQPSSVFGLALTNTQSPAQFNSLLTKSVDNIITESMHETSQLTISSSTSTQQKISTSFSDSSQATGVIKNSDLVKQLSSSINENDIVSSKTISSDTLSEKSKLVDQSLALGSSIKSLYVSTSNDVYSSSTRSLGTADLTTSLKDVPQITVSHLSMGNDLSLSSSSSSSIVMVTNSVNTADIIQTSSTSESNNAAVSTHNFSAVKETSQNVAVSNFAQTSDLTLMSSIFSGEISMAQSKASDFTATFGTNILPTSVLESKSAVSIEISSTRQTFKSEHMLKSSMGIVSSDATHTIQTSESLLLEQKSDLSTAQMTYTSAQSSQVAMTNKPTKDINSSVIPSTIDNIPMTSDLDTVVPTSSTQPSMRTIPLSDLSVTAPSTVSNLMESFLSFSSVQHIELTQSVVNGTNILSSILEREITPSETFSILTTPSDSSLRSKIELTASQEMMSITSSLVITTLQSNVSDFETKSLLSSDLRMFTSTMADSQSSSLEPTSKNIEQTAIPTSFISTTPQTNISAFDTQSLLPSELRSSTLGLINQSSTPEMMPSSPIKHISSFSIFDMTSTFSSDSIFQILNVSDTKSSMPTFQTSALVNASGSSTFNILPTPMVTISSDGSLMLNISSIQTSKVVDLSSELLMFNATPTLISITQTQNFTTNLVPELVSTIFGSSLSLNQSEYSINTTSVSQSMFFPMTLTSEANFSSETFLISSSSFPATLPMMNFSSSLELTNFTSEILPNSSIMILTAATDLPTISLEMSNSSDTPIQIASTLNYNLTTQPMKTTDFLSDLIMNVTATYIASDILQSLNLSSSEMRSELTTVYMSRNDSSVSGELTSITILPNATSDSVLETYFNSTIDSTSPVVIQPTVAISSQLSTSMLSGNESVSGDLFRTTMYMNSTSDFASSMESTLPVIIQPTMTISSSIVMETFNTSIITMPSVETLNMSSAMTSTNVVLQESSSIDMKTDNMSALITPTVPISSLDFTSSNFTIATVQPTVPVSSADVISSSPLETNNLTSIFIESSTATVMDIFTSNLTTDYQIPSVTSNASQTIVFSSEFIENSSENLTGIMSSTTVEPSLTTTFMPVSDKVNQTGIMLSTTVEPSLTTTFMSASEIVNQTGIMSSTTVEPGFTTTFISASEIVNQTGVMSTTVEPSLTTSFMSTSEIVNQTGIMSSTTVEPSLTTTFLSASELVNSSSTTVKPSLTPILSSASEMAPNSSEYVTPSSAFTTVSTTDINKPVSSSTGTVAMSTTMKVGPVNSSEPVVTPSTPHTSSIIATEVPSSTESLTVSTSPSKMITSGVLTSTGVFSQTQVLTSAIHSTSHIQMSSSVFMTTDAPTTETTTTSTTTQPTTTTTPTTTTPPPTTTPDVKATYWVKTGILVPVTVDVSTVTFKTKVESGLANAYDLAFQKQGQARRRKRFVQIGKAGINVTDVSRAPGKEDVTLGYTVDKDGTTLPASEAVAATSSISDQMMAIKLGYEVSSKAETYISEEPATDDTPSNLWIVGAVVGAIVFVVIVIWIVVCIIYWKYKRAPTKGRPLDSESDPPLLRMRSPTGEEEDDARYDQVTGTEPNGTAAYTVTSPKKQKYKVNQEEDLYAEVQKPKHPTSSKSPSKTKSDVESMNMVTEKTKKKKKRNSQAVAGLEEPDENSPKLIRTTHLQKYEPQIDEDLKESKDAERKKNKQRLREKRKKREKDQEAMKEYLSGQEEIDAVLGHSTDEIPKVFVHQPKKKNRSKDKEGQQNEGFVEDESLREARQRMHRLLDDAFALISPAESINNGEGNKVSPENKTQTKQGFRADDLKAQSEKKHEPMFVHTNHTPMPETLQTWSPYRAADQVALISMPNSMQTSLGRDFNRKSPGKRPVANVNYNGPTLTTEPPKPILLRTMDLDKSGGPKEHRKSGNYEPSRSTMLNDIGATKSSNLSGLKSSHIGSKEPSQQSVEMKNLNGNVSHSKPHRPHSKTSKDMDETDIVTTNLSQKVATPDQTIQSIRDELRSIVNSNTSPSKTRHSMADIS
ncbi:uncharacterized protein LOC127704446 isoform X2 [Mytilus californianus]|uniref:uncharacterized protein LOC127704446 isoform X2 n=1 Tax=Mytilus californianus TaxID=6549 RepID=UPI002246CEFE|nr:uncharacterized protein LOC127704446 isoform X2 [Mytilus californianus]